MGLLLSGLIYTRDECRSRLRLYCIPDAAQVVPSRSRFRETYVDAEYGTEKERPDRAVTCCDDLAHHLGLKITLGSDQYAQF